MVFVCQIYANLTETGNNVLDDFHRMLYVFACLSDHCIGKADAARAYRAVVPIENEHTKFASDDLYD